MGALVVLALMKGDQQASAAKSRYNGIAYDDDGGGGYDGSDPLPALRRTSFQS